MKKLLIASLALSVAASAWALPEVRAFAVPSGAAREMTGPLFWMHGTESEARLREYVGRVDESGQGILTTESRPHIDWMGPTWWRDLRIVIDEAKKRGMKVMLFDDYWWPSQGMGGKYPIPVQHRCKDVVAQVFARGAAPASVANEIARTTAFETAKGVYRLAADGDRVLVYSWEEMKNPRKKGLGWFSPPTVNGLDEAAVDWFLHDIYEPHYQHFKKEFEDGTIVGFFFDEPEFQSWWGPALEKELVRQGANLAELLTAFKFKLADAEAQARARYQFLQARAEVWGRTMYGRQSAWCKTHGVYSSGHFLEHADCYYSFGLACGNVMEQMKHVEVPGVDLVCRQYYPNQRTDKKRQIAFGQMPKYASSVAHVYNLHNGLNWCEIFGAYYQDITYPQMKWLLDWHQSQGCYYLIPHSFNPKAPDDTDCPPYFYNGGFEPRYPLFRLWADYNNRCAMLLSEGEHVCRIAQCVPGMSFHIGKTIRPEMFAFALQDAQLDSDWMEYDAVESAILETNPRTGRLSLRTLKGKEHYDILTLPATEFVPWAALEKALAFAKAGGVVVGYGIKPANTPTRGKTATEVQQLVAAIFAQPTAFFLEGEPTGAQVRAALAKNYPGESRPFAIRDVDFPGLDDGRMLAFYHYEKNGDRIFFIANQDFAHARDLTVRAVWPAEQAELWDPMQGTVEKPAVENGCVKLPLAASGAAFLVWPKTPTADARPRVEQPAGAVVAATVKETVTPVELPKPTNAEDQALTGAKWIWHPADTKAQGKVEFFTTVDLPQAGTAELVFSCDNAATFFVNGRQVACQKAGGGDYNGWRKPTKATFELAKGLNRICVLGDNVIPGWAGLVAAVKLPDGRVLRTDETWRVTRDPRGTIQKLVPAKRIGTYGCSPWGRFKDRSRCTRSPFAESVETTLAFTCPPLAAGERLYLVCDDVAGEQSAAVNVNGAFAGGFIGAPYRVDLTRAVKAGTANTLSIKPFRVKNPRLVIQK